MLEHSRREQDGVREAKHFTLLHRHPALLLLGALPVLGPVLSTLWALLFISTIALLGNYYYCTIIIVSVLQITVIYSLLKLTKHCQQPHGLQNSPALRFTCSETEAPPPPSSWEELEAPPPPNLWQALMWGLEGLSRQCTSLLPLPCSHKII